MILIIDGAFQGKLDFARKHLGVTDCFTCDGPEIDFSSGCVRKIETFAACHEDPVGYFEAHRDQWLDCVLIIEDIFCGVVKGLQRIPVRQIPHKMISGRGIDDADLRSLALKFLRDTLTDAVCTTGDDDDLVLKHG